MKILIIFVYGFVYGLVYLLLSFEFPLCSLAHGSLQSSKSSSVFVYSGASTSASLLNIIKVSIPDVGGYFLSTVGVSQTVFNSKYIDLELETQISKHYEQMNAFSLGTAFVVRWTVMPWDRILPGSFGIGNGISYSTVHLDVETSAIQRTSKLLYHIVLEYEFRWFRESSWSGFIRDQHRSGIFGVFDGVTGGSDYLCAGVRYRF